MNKTEKLIYENERGQSIEFSVWSPFFLDNVDGISGLKSSIYTNKGMGQDGSTFLTSSLEHRNIVIQGSILKDKELNREKLLTTINPKLNAKLTWDNGKEKKHVICRVEQAPVINKNIKPKFQISLIANNPYWLDNLIIGEQIATWIGGWKFKFKLPFKFKTKGETKKNIYNSGHVDTPVEVIFKGPAVNPSIINLTTNEFIKVNRTLTADDTLYITTDFGNKKVEFERNGARTNAFNYIDLDSTFFNLQVGDNLLEYNTDNLEPQSVEIKYRNKYLGV